MNRVAGVNRVEYGYATVLHRWQHVFESSKEKVVYDWNEGDGNGNC